MLLLCSEVTLDTLALDEVLKIKYFFVQCFIVNKKRKMNIDLGF